MSKLGDEVLNWAVPTRAFDALRGKYASLVPLTREHAGDLVAAYADAPEIWDYMPYGPFANAGTYGDWIGQISATGDPFFYAIEDQETGQLGGVASYLRINPIAGSIEVGHICFAPRLQKTRAATEAIFLMMSWAFDAGYRRFEWKCNALNRGSRAAAQRYGMSFEGVHRQAAVMKGRNRDTAWFSALDREWSALKPAFTTWLDESNFDASGRQKQSLRDLTSPLLQSVDPTLIGDGS